MTDRPGIVLICAPIVGLLDNWLPVIERLRSRNPGVTVSCVFPARRMLLQVRDNPALQRLCEALFDEFHVSAGRQTVFQSSGLAPLLDFAERDRTWKAACRIDRVFGRLALVSGAGYAVLRLMAGLAGGGWPRPVDVTRLGRARAMLMDIRETEKPYCRALLDATRDVPAYSLAHGLGLGPRAAQNGIDSQSGVVEPAPGLPRDMCALLHAPGQAEIYAERYGLHHSRMKQVGILRHDPQWLQRLRGAYDDLPDRFAEGFVFLISRPATGLLPPERKRNALRAIRDAVMQYGPRRIVIKRHPKEAEEDHFAEILGESEYGRSWIFSRNHPMDLGARCEFGVSFYSGIVVDLVWLGVPSIEYLDLRRLAAYDHPESLRDAAGDPVMEYRALGLALGVQDEAGLARAVQRIRDDRESVLTELRNAYDQAFPPVEDAPGIVAQEIEKVLG